MTAPKALEPPYNLDAEQALLGALIIDPDMLIAQPFDRTAFHSAANGDVWEAFWALKERGLTPDYVTIRDELDRKGRLEAAGGDERLLGLITAASDSQHTQSYLALVREAHERRRLIRLAGDIARAAYDERAPLGAQVPAFARDLLRLAGEGAGAGRTMGQAARELYDRLQDPHGRERVVVSTGIRPLDTALNGGVERGRVTLVGARPGEGKSALGAQISDLASEAGRRVAVFSLEMGADEWAERIAFRRARVDRDRYYKNECSAEEVRRVNSETVALTDRDNLIIDDNSRLTTSAMIARCAEWEPDLVITDHLRLFADRHDNDVLRLGQISWAHKILAKELNCAVIALAQLNRGGEGVRPQLSHLRGSGEIEENADVILFLQRERDYKTRSDVAVFTFGKYRNGNAGQRVEMAFVGAYMLFAEIAPPSVHEPAFLQAEMAAK